MRKIGFLGMGNMGRALAGGMAAAGAVRREDIFAYAPHQDRLRTYCGAEGFHACDSAEALARACDCLVVAVKPYLVEEVLTPLLPLIQGKMLLSVASGWDHEKYCALLGGEAHVQYVMPNTPCAVGEGVIILEELSGLSEEELAWAKEILGSVAVIETLPARLMGVGASLAGCGPAFCAMFIEALGDAGVKYGLPRAAAYRLASQMVKGTGAMQLQTGQHPGAIKDGVCSPGGTTIRGVEALERAGLRAACMDAVRAVMEFR